MRMRRGWSSNVFGRMNKFMISAAESVERRVIRGRVGAFPDIFSMTNDFAKGAESRSEPRIRLEVRVESVMMMGACLLSKEDSVVL